jgi:hypothetical protein
MAKMDIISKNGKKDIKRGCIMDQNDVMDKNETKEKMFNNIILIDGYQNLRAHFNQNRAIMFFTGSAFRPHRNAAVQYSLNGATV